MTALCFLCPMGKIYTKKEEIKSKGRQWQVPRVSGWRCKKTGIEPVCVWLPLVVVEGPPSRSQSLSIALLVFRLCLLLMCFFAGLREGHIRKNHIWGRSEHTTVVKSLVYWWTKFICGCIHCYCSVKYIWNGNDLILKLKMFYLDNG